MHRFYVLSASMLMLMALVTGCARRASLAQVSGTVTYEGKPIKEGTITFKPDSGPHASGHIDNGKIVGVTTYESDDGAPIGKHKVAITVPESADPDNPDIDLPRIPQKYSDPSKSGLTAEISAGGPPLTLDLKSGE
jgi:hypothetical protein